jgi:peptide/nickel transport system substrate-binding protein
MRRRWIARAGLAALAAAAAIGAAACGGDSDSASTSGGDDDLAAVISSLGGPVSFGEPARGGTFRIANTAFANSAGFDPTGEYYVNAWAIYRNLMLRPLVSYRFTAGERGDELVPDLATELPEVSSDGLTYTFTIKEGVAFGPPVNRKVTARDVAYAFERIATPSVAAGYAFYYTPIEGFTEFSEGTADAISGIATPDDRTITFTLTQPVGDFLYRLALPAAAPIPEEVARCHTQAAEYGRYVISTGPYMIEGADDLDISSCASQEPIAGFDPTTGLDLVRNPSYDPATDDTAIRQSFPDRFEFSVNTNLANIFDQIERGELEGSFETPTTAVLRRYLRDPDDRARLRVNSGDSIWFAVMNLTTPPFDDVHVRRAMNIVMDLEGILRAWGGPVQGTLSQSVIPRSMLPEVGEDFQPFQRPPFAGDVEAARAEMARSRHDSDKDGRCDAPACDGVIDLNQNLPPWSTIGPIVAQSAAQIGVGLETRAASLNTVTNVLGTTARRTPFSTSGGWIKDYADPSTFFAIYDGRNITPNGNIVFSLVGVTQDREEELGITVPPGGVPSIDADIEACQPLSGQARADCWAGVDRKLVEEIAPQITLLDATATHPIGPAVTSWDYDQSSGQTALAHVAVDPSLQN